MHRQVHSNGGGDARSGLAPRLRDPLSIPFDYCAPDMRKRQTFLIDKFDCAERDKYIPAGRNQAMDAQASSTRSSDTLFSNVASSDSSVERKAPGRRGVPHENGSYGSGMCRPLDIPAHVRSPPDYGKAERDLFSANGGPSPGYSSSLSMEKPMRDSDGIHSRSSHLSPHEIRPASSPCLDRSSRFDLPTSLYGRQNARAGPSLWEHDRSKLSSCSTEGDMSFSNKEKVFLGRPDYHRRTHSLPKLEAPKDWSGGRRELFEGRVDRYGSALSRELACSDVLSISNKEHRRYDRRTQAHSLFGGFSSHSPCTPSNSTHLTNIGATPDYLLQPRPSSSPHRITAQRSFLDQVDQDFDAGSTRPKKKPRLTWGQGLAKYEKSKIEVDHSDGKNSKYGHDGTVESHRDVHAFSDCQSPLTENGSVSPLFDQHREQDSCDSGVISGCDFDKSSTPKDSDIGHRLGTHESLLLEQLEDQSKANVGELGEDLPFSAAALEASILHGVHVSISSFQGERPKLSKDVLTCHVEKVEQEIDRLEKELVKLGSDCVEEFASPPKELVKPGSDQVQEFVSPRDASTSKVEVHGGESYDTSVSAAETQLPHCAGSVIVVSCTEILPLLDSGNVDMQLPETSDYAQALLSTQSDLGRTIVLDSVLGGNLSAAQSGELQCEGGLLRTDSEMIRADSEMINVQLPKASDCAQDLLTTQSDLGRTIVVDSVLGGNLSAAQSAELQYEGGLLRADSEMISIDKGMEFVESVVLPNTVKAEISFAHLNLPKVSANFESGKLYGSPQESNIWKLNAESHSRKRKSFQASVLEDKLSSNFLEKVLAVKFRTHREAWQQKQHGGVERKKNSKVIRDDSNSVSHQSSIKLWSDSGLKGKNVDKTKMLKIGLCTEDKRGFLRMPAMFLGRGRELHKFETKNGLVVDPVSAEQERKFSNPWSLEEKSLFLEKFSIFGKDFRRIASFLELKTVADCVEFYYRNRKTQEFERLLFKRRLEKYCRYYLEKFGVEESAFHLATDPCFQSSHCDLETLSFVAATAAAMSEPPSKLTYLGLAGKACIKVSWFAVKGLRNVKGKGPRITRTWAMAFDEALKG